jgi:hypothetical protein
LKVLFEEIKLTPTMDQMKALERNELDMISTHVSLITFVPPMQIMDLPFEKFSKMMTWIYQKQMSAEASEKQAPLSEEKILQAFRYYHASVPQQGLRQDEQLRRIWIQNLKKCDRLLRISLKSGNEEQSLKFLENVANAGRIPGPYDQCHLQNATRYHNSILGNLLLRLVVQCLAEAGTSIRALDIEHPVAHSGDEVPVWFQLDCSQLQEVKFRATDYDFWSLERCNAQIMYQGFVAISKKCHLSIDTFEYDSGEVDDQILWLGHEIELPNLKSLHLGGILIDQKAIGQWIKRMPELHHIQMKWLEAKRDHMDWKFVWDAIRDHSNDILVEIDQLHTSSCTGVWDMVFRKSTVDDYLATIERNQQSNEFYLCQYIAGRIGWNEKMYLVHSCTVGHFSF